MGALTRRAFFSGLAVSAAYSAAKASSDTLRTQVAGQWCFLKLPPQSNRQVVLTLHGAGESVGETSSSWEMQAGATKLMGALLENGFAVAQSNSAARHGNGMWGNPDSQRTTAAFIDWLRTEHSFHRVHAIAVSAGNLVLANLKLFGTAKFETAVMLAPCLSLVSEYRCPGGVNRVKTIAEAYGFENSRCPGDPERDLAFQRATAHDDPLRNIERLDDSGIRAAFADTRWLGIYETHDPRVPPAENLLPFASRLGRAGVPVRLLPMEAETHGSQELFLKYVPAIVTFIRGGEHAA
jgi:hypothetical protein